METGISKKFVPALFEGLAVRGGSTIGRVPAPPEPFGRIGITDNLFVACCQRCPRITSSSRLELVSQALCAATYCTSTTDC